MASGARPFSIAERELILATLDTPEKERDRLFLIMGWTLGQRVSQQLSLSVGQFIEGKEIKETLTVDREHIKGGKMIRRTKEGKVAAPKPPHHYPLGVGLRAEIAKYFTFAELWDKPTQKVFPTIRQRIDDLYKHIKKACNLKGNISSHSGRKTLAFDVWHDPEDAKNIIAVQTALHHDQIKSTQAYVKFLTDKATAYVRKLGDRQW